MVPEKAILRDCLRVDNLFNAFYHQHRKEGVVTKAFF